jgi:hypothetical protein
MPFMYFTIFTLFVQQLLVNNAYLSNHLMHGTLEFKRLEMTHIGLGMGFIVNFEGGQNGKEKERCHWNS